MTSEAGPGCGDCGAGSVYGFNWQMAQTSPFPGQRIDVAAFVAPEPLRHGMLYACRSCGHPWYLHGEPAFMHIVPRARLDLIRRWNERAIVLNPEHAAQLAQIGCTPPDLYGNGRQYRETPCTVVTAAGERIDLAVISIQRHAPFEAERACRLATEVAEVHASPHALPLPVRLATSRAEEARMGFAPTLVELPGGELVALSWRPNFFVRPGVDARGIVVSSRSIAWWDPAIPQPAVYRAPPDITYFVADGADGLA
ncbi:MAG: hypothetical protein ACREUG_05515 [Steroidobacteraceae bacterium]